MRIFKKDAEQISHDGHTFDGHDGVFDVPDDAASALVRSHGFQFTTLGTPINLDQLAAKAQADVDAKKPKRQTAAQRKQAEADNAADSAGDDAESDQK